MGSHITYSRRVHALLYVCTSPAVQCLLLVPQGPSGPIGWPQSRHTRQLCSCCGRCQLLPDLAAATGSFPFRRHAVGRGAGFLFPEGLSVGPAAGWTSSAARYCACLPVCSRVCLGRDGGTSADWICGTLGGAHRMNFE